MCLFLCASLCVSPRVCLCFSLCVSLSLGVSLYVSLCVPLDVSQYEPLHVSLYASHYESLGLYVSLCVSMLCLYVRTDSLRLRSLYGDVFILSGKLPSRSLCRDKLPSRSLYRDKLPSRSLYRDKLILTKRAEYTFLLSIKMYLYSPQKFTLYRANFTETAGSVLFHNRALNQSNNYIPTLQPNPVTTHPRKLTVGITTTSDAGIMNNLSVGRKVSTTGITTNN